MTKSAQSERTGPVWVIAALLGAAIACAPLLAVFEPYDGGEAAVIFPADWTATEVFLASAQADAPMVRYGATANIGILLIEDSMQAEALRQAGAMLIINAQSFGGCLLGDEFTSVNGPDDKLNRSV